MAGRQSNSPAYVIFDKSLATISVSNIKTGNGTHPLEIVETGDKANMADRDLSTSYKNYYHVTGGGTGTSQLTSYVQFDFNQPIWNCLIFSKYKMDWTTSTGSVSMEYSSNGTDWTSLDTTQSGTAVTHNYQVLTMRYLRFWVTNDSSSTTIEVWELKVSGSV